MTRPRLLDLFCGPGGASVGYERAGFDVVGVDLEPWECYPGEVIQDDALAFLAAYGSEYDAIHASPPCQLYSSLASTYKPGQEWPDLLMPTIDAMDRTGLPWVVENVPGARGPFGMLLCGSMFSLRYPRHRYFGGGNWAFPLMAPHSCNHDELDKGSPYNYGKVNKRVDARVYLDGLGLDWVPDPDRGKGLRERKERELGGRIESIPPAYTEWIGEQLMAYLCPA